MKNYKSIFTSFSLLSFFIFYVNLNVNAQSTFGIKGGALYNSLKSENLGPLFDFNNSGGFSIGAFYEKQYFLGPLGFQAELLYQIKGANIFIQRPDLTISGTEINSPESGFSYYQKGSFYRALDPVLWDRHQERYHYLSLPVLLTVQPAKFLNVYTGIELAYMFANPNIYSSEYSQMVLGDKNKFAASWLFGAKLQLGEKTKLDFRYTANLLPLYEGANWEIKNRTFSISIEQALWGK